MKVRKFPQSHLVLEKDGKKPTVVMFDNTDDSLSEFHHCRILYEKYFKNNKLEIFE